MDTCILAWRFDFYQSRLFGCGKRLTEKLHLGWAWCDGRGHRERETAQVNKGENTGMAARKLIKDEVEKGRKLEVLSQM